MFVTRHVVRPLLIACALCLATRTATAGVVVYVDPPTQTVPLGSPFSITLYADISDPSVGWGLDLVHSVAGVATQVGLPSIASPWLSVLAPDGDSLAALAPIATPYHGRHSGTGVALATINFLATAVGTTDLTPAATSGDLTEGFANFPTGFAPLSFIDGEVIVTPEPTTLALLLAGAWAVSRHRRRTR